jgi:hypothetical protein
MHATNTTNERFPELFHYHSCQQGRFTRLPERTHGCSVLILFWGYPQNFYGGRLDRSSVQLLRPRFRSKRRSAHHSFERALAQVQKNWQGKNPLNQTYEDSLRRGDFDLPIVNPSLTPNYDCWCPSCKRDRKMGGKSVWLSDTGDHVATFGVCLPCMNRLDASHQEGKKITTRRCEANLLSRYPFLESRL